MRDILLRHPRASIPGLLAWLGLAVVGCGGGSAGAGASSTAAESRAAALGPEGCTDHDASREAMCLAEGCRWGESLLCIGTPPPDDDGPRHPRPCDCICADDEEACRSVPSAPPRPDDE